MGLGGCMCYNYGPQQYTQEEMHKRVKKLRRKIKKNGVNQVISGLGSALFARRAQHLRHRRDAQLGEYRVDRIEHVVDASKVVALLGVAFILSDGADLFRRLGQLLVDQRESIGLV